jgi:poly(A) polymerase
MYANTRRETRQAALHRGAALMTQGKREEGVYREALGAPEGALYAGAAAVVERLQERGHTAYLVGGSIRDLLLGGTPKDYDVATSALPEEVEQIFGRAPYHTVDVGREFGTIMVLRDGCSYEVTTYRMDGRYEDGRRPSSVSFQGVDVREDVLRRDFTINGLLYDPAREEVIDYVGGIEDLRGSRLRTIGDPLARFGEDRLRMLRAIRFVGRLGFGMDAGTQAAIQQMAAQIIAVSAERIQQEISRILVGAYPAVAVKLLEDTGLLQPIFQPHQEDPRRVERFAILEARGERSLVVSLAAFFYREHLADVEGVLHRLRFGRSETEAVLTLLDALPYLEGLVAQGVARQKRFLRSPLMGEILALAEILAENGEFPREAVQAARDLLSLWSPSALSPLRLLDGHVLQSMGYPASKLLKEILYALEDAQLTGEVKTEEEARAWVRQRYPQERA